VNGVVVKLARAQLRDALRSRWILVYTAVFLALTEALFRFSGSDAKAVLSLATAAFAIVPLGTLILSTTYMYNAREFTELLLAQPIRRVAVFAGLFLGLAVPMTGGFVAGVGVPLLMRGGGDPAQRGAVITLFAVGIALTLAFTAIAFVIALRVEDRLRGVGVALGVWLLATVAYDGLVLTAVALFSDHPIERPLLALMFANPVDLARVSLLLRLDVSALMGYTGAVFARFFGTFGGAAAAAAGLALWIALPTAIAALQFKRKDF
jgi:Cu-processing system permease protein